MLSTMKTVRQHVDVRIRRMPLGLHRKLRHEAVRRDLTVSGAALALLEEALTALPDVQARYQDVAGKAQHHDE